MGQCISCNSSSLDANRQLKKARDIGERLSAREQKKHFISDPYMHQLIEESNQRILLEQHPYFETSPRRGQSHLLYNKKQHSNNNYDIMESPSMKTPTTLHHHHQQHYDNPYHYPTQQQQQQQQQQQHHEQQHLLDPSFQPTPITTTKIIRRVRKGLTFYTSDKTQLDIESEEQQQQQQQQESKKEPENEQSSPSSNPPLLSSSSRPGLVHIYAIRENLTLPENVGKKRDTYLPNENGALTQKVQQEQRPIPTLTKKQLKQQQQQQQQQQHDNMISSFANAEDVNYGQKDTEKLQDPVSSPHTRASPTATASSSTLPTPLPPTKITSPLQHHQGTLSPSSPSPLMMNTTTTTNAAQLGSGGGGGGDIFSPQAMASLPNPPPNPIVDWVCVSSKYQIYICDTGLRMDQCHEIVYQTEQACRGHYNAYTYAKQTLGCREYPALARGCLEPVHKTCHAIMTRLLTNATTAGNEQQQVVAKPTMTNENEETTQDNEKENQNDQSTNNNTPPPKNNITLVLDDREPHVVKYDVTKRERQKLDMHTDKSEWSFLIALSDGCGWDYDGGGTYFEGMGATVHLQRGQCLIFPGKLRHCGQKITKGLRFLLVGFLVDKTQSQSNLALAAAATGAAGSTTTATTTSVLTSSPSAPSSPATANDGVTSSAATTPHPQEVTKKTELLPATTMDTITTTAALANEEEENVVNGSCCGI